jgi:hypothetical protein
MTTPRQLLTRLAVFYACLIAALILLLIIDPPALHYLPLGGNDALRQEPLEVTSTSVSIERSVFQRDSTTPASAGEVGKILIYLCCTLLTTLLLMLPVTWTYSATRYAMGPSRSFVRALVLMPVCATTVVWLIQDSLALAFGLAALVAAVRYRVSLAEPIDGVYVFAAICVGLAGGVGHLGVALLMTLVFTVSNAVLWAVDYGNNPVDDARRAAKLAKLRAKGGSRDVESAP